MGIEKMGMNLAQKAVAWTKACGKRSILETRAVNKHIKPQKLGYICPDKTINFQNAEAAKEYSKNRAIAALQGKNPHERLLIVDKNRVLDEIEGSSSSVVFTPFTYKGSKLSAIHGHPDSYAKGCAAPVSAADASIILCWKKFNEIIAYNTKGEFSELKKVDSIDDQGWFSNLKKKFKNSTNIRNSESVKLRYTKMFIPPEILKKYKEINKKIGKCFFKGTQNEYDALITEKEKLAKMIIEAQLTETGCKQTHDFWLKYAKKYNLEYTTNFSNL